MRGENGQIHTEKVFTWSLEQSALTKQYSQRGEENQRKTRGQIQLASLEVLAKTQISDNTDSRYTKLLDESITYNARQEEEEEEEKLKEIQDIQTEILTFPSGDPRLRLFFMQTTPSLTKSRLSRPQVVNQLHNTSRSKLPDQSVVTVVFLFQVLQP